MKNKKLIMGFVAVVLAVSSVCVLSNMNESTEFVTTTLDVAEADGSEISNETTVQIEENKTPLATIIGGSTGTKKNLSTSDLETIRDYLIDSVNDERKTGASNKLVSQNNALDKTGIIRANEIISVWSHTRPNGTNWETVLSANGVEWKKAGEDLAKIETTAKASYDDSFIETMAEQIHTSLMNSPTHKAVILSQDYEQIGIGVVSKLEGNKLTVYVAEHFKNKTVTTTDISKATVSNVKDAIYTGKNITQNLTVKYNGTALKINEDYTVKYKNNKNVGTASVVITGKGNYTGTKTVTFKINPKATSISKVSAVSKGITVKWTKQASQTTGYEVQYSTSSNFKSGNKTVTINKNSTVTTNIKKLTGNKKYYVRVRTYKTVSGKKYYSSWSSVKNATAKK
jgi:uncharacterized protein YkwD